MDARFVMFPVRFSPRCATIYGVSWSSCTGSARCILGASAREISKLRKRSWQAPSKDSRALGLGRICRHDMQKRLEHRRQRVLTRKCDLHGDKLDRPLRLEDWRVWRWIVCFP